jgi:hypothetical protein
MGAGQKGVRAQWELGNGSWERGRVGMGADAKVTLKSRLWI